jgi:hypothetical protein
MPGNSCFVGQSGRTQMSFEFIYLLSQQQHAFLKYIFRLCFAESNYYFSQGTMLNTGLGDVDQ